MPLSEEEKKTLQEKYKQQRREMWAGVRSRLRRSNDPESADGVAPQTANSTATDNDPTAAAGTTDRTSVTPPAEAATSPSQKNGEKGPPLRFTQEQAIRRGEELQQSAIHNLERSGNPAPSGPQSAIESSPSRQSDTKPPPIETVAGDLVEEDRSSQEETVDVGSRHPRAVTRQESVPSPSHLHAEERGQHPDPTGDPAEPRQGDTRAPRKGVTASDDDPPTRDEASLMREKIREQREATWEGQSSTRSRRRREPPKPSKGERRFWGTSTEEGEPSVLTWKLALGVIGTVIVLIGVGVLLGYWFAS